MTGRLLHDCPGHSCANLVGEWRQQAISERYLIPALYQLLETFPFTVLGFHSDNGSEYINKRVAELLEKLRIEFTKSP